MAVCLVLYANHDATLMRGASVFRQIGNKAYKYAFPAYRVAYRSFKAYTDRAERQLLQKILPNAAVVVDAGANIGIYSEFLSRCVGPNGVVHSFEPCPDNFMRLRCATRKLPNVRPCAAVVGEHSGETLLYVSDKLNVDHRAYASDGNPRHAVQVRMVALDEYFKAGERVDLLKLDIQGYELHALRGAKRIINENPDIKLLLEFWPYGLKQAGVNWNELIEMLEGFAMNIMFVQAEGLTPFETHNIRIDADWYVNLFASRGAREGAIVRSGAVSTSSDDSDRSQPALRKSSRAGGPPLQEKIWSELQLLATNFYRRWWYHRSLRGKGIIGDGVNHPLPAGMAGFHVHGESPAAAFVDLHSPVVAVGRNREHIRECGRDYHAGEHANQICAHRFFIPHNPLYYCPFPLCV